MDNLQPVVDLVIPIKFEHTVAGQKSPSTGKGQLTIQGETVSLSGRERRPLHFAKDVAMTFPTTQVANVTVEEPQKAFSVVIAGGKVRFSVYPDTTILGLPQHEFVVSTKNQEDAQRIQAAFPTTVSEHIKQLRADQNTFSILLSQTTQWAFFTPMLVVANAVVFILMAIGGVAIDNPALDGLIKWGANYGPLTFSGDWWRLFTSTFVHIGVMHIAFNMWALFTIGRLVERLFGNTLFLLIYIGAGILGSMTSVIVHPELVCAGASGAIFGLYGALLGFTVRQRGAIPMSVLTNLRNSAIGFVGYNLFYGVLPGIDNSAHLGGLVCGAVLGYVAAMPLDSQVRKTSFISRMALTCGALALLISASIFVIQRSESYAYIQFYNFYAAEEARANECYNDSIAQAKDGKLDDDVFANKLESDCLNRWKAICSNGKAVHLSQSNVFRKPYDYYMQLAFLRYQAMDKMVDGVRKHDDNLIDEANRIQQEAGQLIDDRNKKS